MFTPPKSPNSSGLQREAIERLWRSHRRWVAAVIYAHKPHDVDLEDLVQEVAMRLVKNIEQLDIDRIRPWLRTVAINVARSAGRRSTTRKKNRNGANVGMDSYSLQHLPARDQSSSLIPANAGGERGQTALQLMQELPVHYREPLLLSLRGLSHRQISLTTDLPVTTIETRLIRARKMLREELERRESESLSQANAAIPHPSLLKRQQSS